MAEKLLWVSAILLYGLAAVLLVNFHWTFWVAVILGTLAATVGNALRVPDGVSEQGERPQGSTATL